MCSHEDFLFVAASDNKIKEWQFSQFDKGFTRAFEAHKSEVREVCASKDLFFSADISGTVMSWEFQSSGDEVVVSTPSLPPFLHVVPLLASSLAQEPARFTPHAAKTPSPSASRSPSAYSDQWGLWR